MTSIRSGTLLHSLLAPVVTNRAVGGRFPKQFKPHILDGKTVTLSPH